MKQILFVLSICLVMYSCKKADDPIDTTPVSLSQGNGLDSMHLSYGVLYHLVFATPFGPDSANSIVIYPDSFAEYHTFVDPIIHVTYIDSIHYLNAGSNSTYFPLTPYDYANYKTRGYCNFKYYPTAELYHNDSFKFHDNLIKDTFVMQIGTLTRYYTPTEYFKPVSPDSPIVRVLAIYQ